LRREGYGPIRLDESSRAWRRAHGLAPDPVLALVSRRLDLDPGHAMFTEAPARPIVFTCEAAPAERRAALAATAEVVVVGEHSADPHELVAELHRRGLTQILSEGGPHVLGDL